MTQLASTRAWIWSRFCISKCTFFFCPKGAIKKKILKGDTIYAEACITHELPTMIFAESGKMQPEIQRGNGRLERNIWPSDFHNMEKKIGFTKFKLMVWTPTTSTILEQRVNENVGRSLRELRCLIHPVILSYLGLDLAIIKGKALIPQDECSFTRQNSWGGQRLGGALRGI